MAEVISFVDIVRQRQRRRERELTQRCIQVLELNLHFALELYDLSPAEERRTRARQVRQLSEVLEYALASV